MFLIRMFIDFFYVNSYTKNKKLNASDLPETVTSRTLICDVLIKNMTAPVSP